MLALSAAGVAVADDVGGDDPDDPFAGFDEGDDEPAADADDLLGGFDDAGTFEDAEAFDARRRIWDLTGSVSAGVSVNYVDHESSTGTDYTGLSRLRTRLNLQLDVDLPARWRGRLAGFGFYDWAYLANGRSDYTGEVLDVYEWDADFQEVWLHGPVHPNVDLKIGRQIVNWGRSDSLRVIDVLNPLDNREPGLVDIEDLRRPVAMARGQVFWREWTLSLIAIPEIRFDKNPPLGSDFFTAAALGGDSVLPERIPDESFDNTEWAAALRGIFSGWDVSFHFARLWADQAYLRPDPAGPVLGPDGPSLGDAELRHSRFTMVGGGANYAWGSWLAKVEVAWLDGIDFTTSSAVTVPTPMGPTAIVLPTDSVRGGRLDAMVGLEYYGFAYTNVALEVANRHVLGFRDAMRPLFGVQRNALETALRITRTFMNERLEVTLLALVFGNHAQDGSVVRLNFAYDIRDALVASGGILLFNDGDRIPFDAIDRNDRLFFELKYSF